VRSNSDKATEDVVEDFQNKHKIKFLEINNNAKLEIIYNNEINKPLIVKLKTFVLPVSNKAI
jgi:hypothetical protein